MALGVDQEELRADGRERGFGRAHFRIPLFDETFQRLDRWHRDLLLEIVGKRSHQLDRRCRGSTQECIEARTQGAPLGL
jgi:hypothetical protein